MPKYPPTRTAVHHHPEVDRVQRSMSQVEKRMRTVGFNNCGGYIYDFFMATNMIGIQRITRDVFCYFGCLIVMLISIGCDSRGSRPPASSVTKASIQDEIRDVYAAIYAGDAETVWKFTHPKVTAITIEMAGGVSEAKAALQASLDRGKAVPMELESRWLPAPHRLI
jgi:hypothetical protein